jgi:hypothetical protein
MTHMRRCKTRTEVFHPDTDNVSLLAEDTLFWLLHRTGASSAPFVVFHWEARVSTLEQVMDLWPGKWEVQEVGFARPSPPAMGLFDVLDHLDHFEDTLRCHFYLRNVEIGRKGLPVPRRRIEPREIFATTAADRSATRLPKLGSTSNMRLFSFSCRCCFFRTYSAGTRPIRLIGPTAFLKTT